MPFTFIYFPSTLVLSNSLIARRTRGCLPLMSSFLCCFTIQMCRSGCAENFFAKVQWKRVRTTSIVVGREGSNILDEAWIKAARDGGPEHYRPFVQAYGSYIYKTVFAVLQSPHDAEDITQEVLLQIYRSLPECRMDGLKTWITRIAVNRAIDFKRSRARRPEQLIDQESFNNETARNAEAPGRAEGMLAHTSAPAAESIAMLQEDRRQVLEQIEKLPDGYREVITAYYMEDKSYEQIANETGLERKSVESKLYRARNWMKRHWRKEDFE